VGTYLLRNTADLDGSGGDDAARLRRVVHVTTSAVSIDASIGAGQVVSGSVVLPLGAKTNRIVRLSLRDAEGTVLRSASVHMANSREATFRFRNLADGGYTLSAVDGASPPSLGAPPVSLKISGSDLTGLRVLFAPAGVVTGRVAVERLLSGGGVETIPLAGGAGILPGALNVAARADPWVTGGYREARRTDCGTEACPIEFDSQGRFKIEGLLPGRYDVLFLTAISTASLESRALEPVNASAAGVEVQAGRVRDLGLVLLRSAASLSGRVTDSVSGTPIPGVFVRATPSSDAPGRSEDLFGGPTARTDDDGRYTLRGLDLSVRYYDLVFGPRDKESLTGGVAYMPLKVASVDLKSSTTIDASMISGSFAITGRAVSASDAALVSGDGAYQQTGAEVFVRSDSESPDENLIGDIIVRRPCS